MGEYIASPAITTAPFRIVTPVGMLGYGFSTEELDGCLSSLSPEELKSTALILDSGSTDSGPTKLAFGDTTCPREAYVSDLRGLLRAWKRYGTPIVIGSAGGDGSNAHVDLFADIITEILQEEDLDRNCLGRKPKVLKIYTEIDKTLIRSRNEAGRVTGCGSTVPRLTQDDIEACPTIVAQMGAEPYVDTMLAHADFDVIIGGRAYDPSPYVAYAAFKICKEPPELFRSGGKDAAEKSKLLGKLYHMGKIMECGALCAVPKSYSAMATIYSNGDFDVVPLNEAAKCTPVSVAAHTFYEKSRPDILHGPGGAINLTQSTYKPLADGRSVRISGAKFEYSEAVSHPYTVKMEGAKAQGYRTMFMGGIRDTILVSQIDSFLDRAKQYAKRQHPVKEGEKPWELEFHVYGQNGVMGALEPRLGQAIQSHEVFVIGECVAETQVKAAAVASSARVAVTHGPYPGQKATGGNFAFGIGGKPMLDLGPCAEFAVYHLLELEQGEQRGREQVDGKDKVNDSNGLFRFALDRRLRTESVSCERVLVDSAPLDSQTQVAEVVVNGHSTPNGHATTDGHSKQAQAKHLSDIAKVIRSKNAGPFEITLDVLFDNAKTYQLVKKSGILNAKIIAKLYGLAEEEVLECIFFDQAMGFKATIPRKRASGGPFETDVQGSQQYAGLFEIELPQELIEQL